jgi:hypothetical protein
MSRFRRSVTYYAISGKFLRKKHDIKGLKKSIFDTHVKLIKKFTLILFSDYVKNKKSSWFHSTNPSSITISYYKKLLLPICQKVISWKKHEWLENWALTKLYYEFINFAIMKLLWILDKHKKLLNVPS